MQALAAIDPIRVTVRSVMSMMQTTTSYEFSAFVPPKTVDALIAIEEVRALQIGSERRKSGNFEPNSTVQMISQKSQ